MAHEALSDTAYRRYMRQLVIQPLNIQGQARLLGAGVLVVGAGGLGSPVIAYLAAAGVGRISIVDHDEVALSNLNRQVLFKTRDIGGGKAELAAEFARSLNDEIRVAGHPIELTRDNVDDLVAAHDLVVDGSDNIETRRLVARAALRWGKVLVCGAVGQLEGHVAVFPPKGVETPLGFDSLYPESGAASSCEAVGVVGAVTGVVGCLMAMECIKALTGLGQSIVGRMVRYDGAAGVFEEHPLATRPAVRYLVGG